MWAAQKAPYRMTPPAPDRPSARWRWPRRRSHSDPLTHASPTSVPNTTRMVGVIRPRSMEYLKNRRPARPRATAPSSAAPRIPIQRSQSIFTGGDGGIGGAGGTAAAGGRGGREGGSETGVDAETLGAGGTGISLGGDAGGDGATGEGAGPAATGRGAGGAAASDGCGAAGGVAATGSRVARRASIAAWRVTVISSSSSRRS